MTPATKAARLNKADYESIKLLQRRARSLRSAGLVIGAGMCEDRAKAAFEEAASILEDAARNCARMPNVVRD